MSVTNRHAEWPWCKAKHCWCTIDAHFQNAAGSVSLSLLLINAAYSALMNVRIQLPLRLPKLQDQKSLTYCWLSFSGWGRERVSLVFDYKGGQYIRKGQWYTNVNTLRLSIGYLNATTNRKTPKLELEIGTDGSSQTWPTPPVDEYRSGFGPPKCGSLGVELNGSVIVVRTWMAGGLPRPVANPRKKCLSFGNCYRQCNPTLSENQKPLLTRLMKKGKSLVWESGHELALKQSICHLQLRWISNVTIMTGWEMSKPMVSRTFLEA